MLRTYAEFLAYAEQCGVMVFSENLPEGFPNLYDLTSPYQWHTGNFDTDPWQWRDRAAIEKRLALGISSVGERDLFHRSCIPSFIKPAGLTGAWRNATRWGHIKKLVYDVYRLFEENGILDTAEIRRRMNVRKSEGASAVDSAIVRLQSEFYITVCGNRRKVGFDGAEYGWPANTYCLTDDWATDWLREPLLPTSEARAKILAHIKALDSRIDTQKAEKLLFKI